MRGWQCARCLFRDMGVFCTVSAMEFAVPTACLLCHGCMALQSHPTPSPPKRAKPGADISVTRFPLWRRIWGASSSPLNGHVTGKDLNIPAQTIVPRRCIKRSVSIKAGRQLRDDTGFNLFLSEVLRQVFVVCKRFCKIKLHYPIDDYLLCRNTQTYPNLRRIYCGLTNHAPPFQVFRSLPYPNRTTSIWAREARGRHE